MNCLSISCDCPGKGDSALPLFPLFKADRYTGIPDIRYKGVLEVSLAILEIRLARGMREKGAIAE